MFHDHNPIDPEDEVRLYSIMASYDFHEEVNGCGYWGVCGDHACPCASTSMVAQGFNYEVYKHMISRMKHIL